MSGWTEMGTGARALVLVGGVAVVAGAGALIWKQRSTPPIPAATEQAATAPAAAPEKAASAEQATAEQTQPAEADANADQTASATQAEVVAPPAFDVVRVTPEGEALIAGRAEAGSAIKVMIDGSEAAKAVADAQGKFVAMFTLPPSATPRVVKLAMQPATGTEIASADQVVLAPTPTTETAVTEQVATAEQAVQPEMAADQTGAAPAQAATTSDASTAETGQAATTGEVVVASNDATVSTGSTAPADATTTATGASVAAAGESDTTTTDSIATTAVESSSPEAASSETSTVSVQTETSGQTGTGTAVATAGQVAPEADTSAITETPATAPDAQAAPTAVLVSDTGAKVLQGATNMPDNVTIGAISYSSTGAVQLSGRGKPGWTVRLYLDNTMALETKVAADGGWGGTLGEVVPGVYTLRADQIGADSSVQSRYETPFQREAPDVLAALRSRTGKPVNITVQPGFTLWEIAKQNYGDGVMYVRVFEANKAQIKDPDLIYPGQVFAVPKKN